MTYQELIQYLASGEPIEWMVAWIRRHYVVGHDMQPIGNLEYTLCDLDGFYAPLWEKFGELEVDRVLDAATVGDSDAVNQALSRLWLAAAFRHGDKTVVEMFQRVYGEEHGQ